MFQIFDGRKFFWQWDLNQKLIVEDPAITQVHFCNRSESCALVCEIYEDNGLRLVDVPNVLLQDNWPILVYAYDVDHTKVSEKFEVKPKSKPSDYIYTEEELREWEELNEKLAEIEEKGFSEETVTKAIQDYLDKHPIVGGVSSVNNKTGDVILTAGDLGAATETYVDNAIAEIELKPGPAGPKGDRGERGLQGPAGQQGERGLPGPRGEDGLPGKNGRNTVYVGTEEPADPAYNVWINPNGDSSALDHLATKKYVDDAIANIPGGGGGEGTPGEDGATFTPSVDSDGNLSWTNDKGLENPPTVNIKGPQGEQGPAGKDGEPGPKGDQGEQGIPGIQGEKGEQGIPGEPGTPGKDGQDGKTPIKGEDYFTAEDKTSIVNDVLAAMTAAEGVAV